jgi:hypothetical protein
VFLLALQVFTKASDDKYIIGRNVLDSHFIKIIFSMLMGRSTTKSWALALYCNCLYHFGDTA